MSIFQEISESISTLPKSDLWLNEALYGLDHVEPCLSSLHAGAEVLEVGSGAAVLLSHLSSKYKSFNFTGIEPLGDGFSTLSEFHKKLDKFEKKLYVSGYEEFKSDKKYDLIFSINVFEHLSCWKNFLSFVKTNLKDDGKCLILCPNYEFPYESHFKIPIIFNKSITEKFFSTYIKEFENRNDCKGLWSSLNFVKWPKVAKECKKLGLDANFNPEISLELIDRLENDKEFRKRQYLISLFVKFFRKTGLLNLLRTPLLYHMHPYMKFELQIDKMNSDERDDNKPVC